MNARRASELTLAFLRKDGGGPVTFSRVIDVITPPPTRAIAPCPYAFWRNYRPNELGHGVIQGDTLMVIQGSALAALIAGLSTPPRKNDKVTAGGSNETSRASTCCSTTGSRSASI